MEGYHASSWTSLIRSAHNMQHQHSLEHQNQERPLDELHFEDVQSTPIMEGEVKKNLLLPPPRQHSTVD